MFLSPQIMKNNGPGSIHLQSKLAKLFVKHVSNFPLVVSSFAQLQVPLYNSHGTKRTYRTIIQSKEVQNKEV